MSTYGPSWRLVNLDGIGDVEVRRPIVRDMANATSGDQFWWHVCVRRNGREMTKDEVLDLDVEIAAAIATEVTKPRPTRPPSGGSGG